MNTPEELGVKGITPPEGGFKPHSLYSVNVAYCRNNPIHKSFLFVGFVNDKGKPTSYSHLYIPNSGESDLSDVYYLEVIERLDGTD